MPLSVFDQRGPITICERFSLPFRHRSLSLSLTDVFSASLTRRAIAAAFISSFSSSGGLISSHMYHEKHKPRYRFGYSVSLMCIMAQAAVAISLRFAFTFVNHRRSQMNEKEMKEQIEYYGGSELVGDRHPKFRYTL